MAVSAALVKHVKEFEGVHDGDKTRPGYQPVLCPAGVVTIGWGETLIDAHTGKHARGKEALARLKHITRTAEEADRYLEERLQKDRAIICGRYPWLRPHQADALTAMAYNTGLAPVLDSRYGLARALLTRETARVPVEMRRWDKATIDSVLTTLPGLVRRRATEAAMFAEAEPQPMAQAVAPPADGKPSAGEVGAVSTVVAGAASVLATFSQARDVLLSIDLAPGTVGLVLGVTVLGLGVFWLCRARQARINA